jgi:hypothetical protein
MTRRDKHGEEGLGGTNTAPAAPRKRAMRTVTEGAGGAGGRHISNRRTDLSLTHTLVFHLFLGVACVSKSRLS